jgi:hypothetical protein
LLRLVYAEAVGRLAVTEGPFSKSVSQRNQTALILPNV